jgi:glutaredoxin
MGVASANTDTWCYDFKNDLVFGDKGNDVEALKSALIKEGFYKEGWVSESYDVYVAAAVMGFQDKYKQDILVPANLENPTGLVSKRTVKKLNVLYGCKDGAVPAAITITPSQPAITYDQTQRDNVINNAISYIKKYLATGMDIVAGKIDDVIKPFYRFEAKAGDSVVPTYVSTDGKIITFQETDITKEPAGAQGNAPAAEPVKSDKPVVELFVMSHCPYGTQIEKGIIPAVEALGDKIDFQLKFCDYAMHGEEELKEQMRQYCIQKEQKGSLLPYLKCFLKEGKADDCIKQTSLDAAKLTSCVDATEKEFKVIDNYKNNIGYNGQFPGFPLYKEENSRYGVQGSPVLVINGVQLQSNRDSKSLLNTICSSFNSSPDICKKELSSENPVPGFGDGTTTNQTPSGCGQ